MSIGPTRSARPGTKRSRPTGRWCLKSRPIPKCRRYRRTSLSSRPSISPRRWPKAILMRAASSRRPQSRYWPRSSPANEVLQPKRGGAPITDLHAAAYRIPTDSPEADGTFAWKATTLVVVEVTAADEQSGLGYTYADASVASLIGGQLKKALADHDSFDIPACWMAMQRSVRNLGRSGLAACAISAIDAALWDLKARALNLPLAVLLGHSRDRVPIYGSGGFTSYSNERLRDQLAGWVGRDGCRFVKMKVGSA